MLTLYSLRSCNKLFALLSNSSCKLSKKSTSRIIPISKKLFTALPITQDPQATKS